MPYGELVTLLRADLIQYERDLNAAYAKAEAWTKKIEALQARLAAPGVNLGGGAGTGRRDSRFGGGGTVSQARVEQEQAIRENEAHFRKVMTLNRQAEAEQRRMAGIKARADKDEYEREFQKIVVLEKREQAERRFRSMQATAEKENRQLEVNAAKETMRARNADIKQQIELQRFRDKQVKEAATAERQAAKEAMKAKEADIKQQISFKRYLDQQDKNDAQAQRQGQRDEIRIAKVAAVRAEFERTHSTIGRMDRAIQALDGGSLKNLLGTATQVARSFGVIGAFGVAGGIVAAVKGGVDLNREYQRQLTTMGSILAMTTRVTDAQGHSVSRQQAINFQLAEAGKLYTLIRREAASTILTGRELFGAVSANLGLGAAAGMSPEQTVSFTKQITQLAKASGLQGERQFAQETRALLTGQGLQSGTVARILGVFSKKQIDEHVQKGDLFQYIMDRVNKAKPILDKFRSSFDGVMTTLTTKAQDLNRLAFEKFFEKLTRRIGDLNTALGQDKLEMWAERISDGLIKVFDTIDKFVSSGGFQKLLDFFNYLVANGGNLIKIFLAMRGALAVGSAAAGLRDFQRNETQMATQKALLGLQQGAGTVAGVGGAVAATGGAVAGAEGVGAAAAGTVAGGLSAVAGAVAAGLSLVAAALAGWGIGTGISEFLKERTGAGLAERNETDSVMNLRKMRENPKTRFGVLLADAKQRVREAQAAVRQGIEGGETDEPNGRGAKASGIKRIQAAVMAEQKARFDATVASLMDPNNKQNQLRLHSINAENNARLRREAANKERVKAGLEIAKLEDDKPRQIRAQAQLDAIEAKAKISDRMQLNKVLIAIDKNMHEDLKELRAQQLIDYKQMLAQQTGIAKDALDAEYLATLKNIEDKKLGDEREGRLKVAAREHYQRQLRDKNDEQMIAERRFNAEVTGNVIEQLNVEFLEKAATIRKEVEATKTGQEARNEIERKFHALRIERQRKLRDTLQETEDKGRDLARRGNQIERERAQLIKQYNKEIHDAQKQMARDLRDVIREQTAAQRELGHVQRQSMQDTFRLGHERRFVPFENGINRPANLPREPGESLTTRGILQEKFGGVNEVGLQDQTSQLLEGTGINDVLRSVMNRRHGEEVGPAMADRAIRELRNTFAGGDVEGGFAKLQEFGVRPGRDFTKGARQIAATAIGAQNQEAAFQDREARVDLGQQREDQGKAVMDAQQRLQDLDERQTELFKTYADTITNMGVNFNEAILKSADDLKSFRQEVTKFTEMLAASGVKISDAYMNILGGAVNTRGKGAGQGGAETLTKAQGGTVYNLILGAGAVKLDANAQKALKQITDAIAEQALRTAPARN